MSRSQGRSGPTALASEWPETLDVDALIGSGWRPTPFREFVLKIHSRCNLACDYCYMYEMADQTWRSRPHRMSYIIAEHAASRIAEHVRTHKLSEINIILHGGEPLLAGPEFISHAVTAIYGQVGAGVDVYVTLQTNGIRLTAACLQLFKTLGIRVGVSIDGDKMAHDRHRRYANGRGSYAASTAGLRLLADGPYRDLYAGILCTVDIENDPLRTYESMLSFEPPMIDFLLPHGTWTSPPPGRVPDPASTPYADWLIPVFDRWYHRSPMETRIRLFEEIMYLLVGGSSAIEMVGISPAAAIVIETDGSIELSDMLKSAYHGAPWTGLSVVRDSFDTALALPQIAARQIGMLALCDTCQKCQIRHVCGGGLYPHRYKAGSGWANPSVYCPDLMRLILHIRDVMSADIERRRS